MGSSSERVMVRQRKGATVSAKQRQVRERATTSVRKRWEMMAGKETGRMKKERSELKLEEGREKERLGEPY